MNGITEGLSEIQRVKHVLTLARQYKKLMVRPKDYNLFSVLLKINDEVRLHSRFLADLLKPNGSHGLNSKPIEIFFNDIAGLTLVDGQYEHFDVCTEYKNIDIFISNKLTKQAIIIENKIYAPDQEQQLLRYYNIAINDGFENISIIYLSLDGKDPNNSSIEGELGSLKSYDQKINCISYKYDIDKWIELLTQKAANMPFLRESLNQYSLIIKELTGMSTNQEYIQELKNLLMETHSVDIVENLQEARSQLLIDAQVLFWSEMISQIRQESLGELSNLGLSGDLSKVEDEVRSYLRPRSGKNEIGLLIKLSNYKDCFLSVYMEQGDYLFIGVMNDPDKKNKEIRSISTTKEYESDEWWPIYKYIDYKGDWHLDNLSPTQIQLLHDSQFVHQFCQHIISELKALSSCL